MTWGQSRTLPDPKSGRVIFTVFVKVTRHFLSVSHSSLRTSSGGRHIVCFAMANGTYRTTLRIPGLQSFLWTQFLGAFNDNVYKIIVSFYAIRELGPERGMPLAAAVFVLPFLLFSGWSGTSGGRVQQAHRARLDEGAARSLAMGLAMPALVAGRLDLQLGRALPDGRALDVLQPGEVRHRAGDRAADARSRAPTACSR